MTSCLLWIAANLLEAHSHRQIIYPEFAAKHSSS